MPSDYIDVLDPVADHDLNRGLLAWMFGLENLSGGTTLYDIKRCPGYDGTLTNDPTWSSFDGFGGVVLDGSNDYIVQSNNILASLNTGSMEFVVKWSGTQNNNSLASVRGPISWKGQSGSHHNLSLFLTETNPATASIRWDPYVYNTPAGLGTTPVGDGVVRHVGVTWRSGSHAGYIDGVQEFTAATTGSVEAGGSTVFGSWNAGAMSAAYAGCTIYGLRIYNRIVEPSDWPFLYAQWLARYPDTLRRVPSRAWMLGVEQGGGSSTISVAGSFSGYGLLTSPSAKVVSVPGFSNGTGSIAGSPAIAKSTQSQIVGSGTLSSVAAYSASTFGTLTGVGTTVGTPSQVVSAPSVLIGVGDVAGAASIVQSTVGCLVGCGTEVGTGAISAASSGSLSGYGIIVATNDNSVTISVAGSLAGYGVVAASPTMVAAVSAGLAGIGNVTTPAAIGIAASSDIVGSGLITSPSVVIVGASGSVSGYGEAQSSPAIFCAAPGILSGYGVVNGAAAYSVAVVGCITGYGTLYGRTLSTNYYGPVYGTLGVSPAILGTMSVRPGVVGVLAINGTLAVKPPRR